MSAQGSVSLNFGAYPGSDIATVDVTGQTGFVATSLCEAWILPKATTEHSVDEHMIEDIKIDAAYQADGTVRIYGRSRSGLKLYGNFNIAWVWN